MRNCSSRRSDYDTASGPATSASGYEAAAAAKGLGGILLCFFVVIIVVVVVVLLLRCCCLLLLDRLCILVRHEWPMRLPHCPRLCRRVCASPATTQRKLPPCSVAQHDGFASYVVSEPVGSLMELCILARMRAVRVSVGGLKFGRHIIGLCNAVQTLAQGLQSVAKAPKHVASKSGPIVSEPISPAASSGSGGGGARATDLHTTVEQSAWTPDRRGHTRGSPGSFFLVVFACVCVRALICVSFVGSEVESALKRQLASAHRETSHLQVRCILSYHSYCLYLYNYNTAVFDCCRIRSPQHGTRYPSCSSVVLRFDRRGQARRTDHTAASAVCGTDGRVTAARNAEATAERKVTTLCITYIAVTNCRLVLAYIYIGVGC